MTREHHDTTLDLDRLTHYLEQHVAGFRGPLRATKFAGGQSNPTYLLDAQSGRYVLRRQPPGQLLKSAHAVDREFRVLSALADTPVPVARAFHLCEDRDVIGSLFYLMSYEEGRIFWNPALPDIDRDARRGYYAAIVQTLAALHDVDTQAADLADYGRAGNYFERQIGVWTKQYRAAETERIAPMEALIDWLPAHCPTDTLRPSLVHGDFRIDNTILDVHDAGIIRAVVDWELSTLGDPISDAALMCAYRDPAMDLILNMRSAWTSPMIPAADQLAHRYSTMSGRPLAHWPFHMSLAYFKIAIIAAGIDFRRRMAGGEDGSDRVGEVVAPLIALGLKTINAPD